MISLLLLTDNEQAHSRSRIWGTGGWLPPEEREALDWAMLARLSGWHPSVALPTAEAVRASRETCPHWLILACDPGRLDNSAVDELANTLASTEIVVLVRAGSGEHPLSELAGAHVTGHAATVTELNWHGETQSSISTRKPLTTRTLSLAPDSYPVLTSAGLPLIAKRQVGKGCVVSLAFHPSAARDESGIATRLLRQALVECSVRPVAWLDFSGTMILRMDDPGAAQNVYLKSWTYPELTYTGWQEIGQSLFQRNAILSVGYCSGWVDDGDPARGTLTVGDKAVHRVKGRSYPAPEVTYFDQRGVSPGTFHDYVGEYRALRELFAARLVDIELHGFTHMYPDAVVWASAPDRYEAVSWYRELGQEAKSCLYHVPKAQHPLSLGIAAIDNYFDVRPTTLICPGDEWTNDALELALDLDVSFVSSYYLAIRHQNRFCWTTHVCAPYLDEPDAAWFDAQLPVIGYFHDREPSIYGCSWVAECLDRWIECGANRFLSFRDLAVQLDIELDITPTSTGIILSIGDNASRAPTAPIHIFAKVPGAKTELNVEAIDDVSVLARFEWIDETLVHAEIAALPRH